MLRIKFFPSPIIDPTLAPPAEANLALFFPAHSFNFFLTNVPFLQTTTSVGPLNQPSHYRYYFPPCMCLGGFGHHFQ